MKVNDFLDAKKNNLDLIRILLAVLVILGHSAILNGVNGVWIDPISKLFPFTYSGSLAVKLFFFVSGLVMMASLNRDSSKLRFALSRIARLIPALAVLLIVTVLIIGPIVSTVRVRDYFSDPQTFRYLWRNLIFWGQSSLPGVFESNHYPNAVNGSLWSLMYEVGCYIALITIVSLLKNNRKWITLVSVAIILLSLFPKSPFVFLLSSNPDVNLLPMSFALGVLFSVNSKIIEISIKTTAASWLLLLLCRGTAIEPHCLLVAGAMTILFFASRSWAVALKPRYDVSYGTYLWGFLVQQLLFNYLGSIYTWLHFVIAATVSMALGLLSYVLVEKRSIELGKSLYRRIRQGMINEHMTFKRVRIS